MEEKEKIELPLNLIQVTLSAVTSWQLQQTTKNVSRTQHQPRLMLLQIPYLPNKDETEMK